MVEVRQMTDPRGRTPVDPARFRGAHVARILTSGQSMLSGWAKIAKPVPTPGRVFEFSITDGKIYESDGDVPMNMDQYVDDNGPRYSVLPVWGNNLFTEGKAEYVLFGALNIGGTSSIDWCPAGSLFDSRLIKAIDLLRALGMEWNYWIHMLGQQNLGLAIEQGLDPASTTTNFAGHSKWMVDNVQGHGMPSVMVTGQGCYWQGFSDVRPDLAAAVVAGQRRVAEICHNVALGPNDDEWSDPIYRVDGVHQAQPMVAAQWSRWKDVFPVF